MTRAREETVEARPGRAVLLGTLALTCVAAALILAGSPRWVEIPCAALLIFVLPGLVWTRVVVPAADAPLASIGYAVATSVGLTMVVGILIDALPAGLTRTDWCIGQVVMVALGTAAALLRQPRGERTVRRDGAGPRKVRGVLLRLVPIAAIVGAAIVISVSSGEHYDAHQHFTALTIRADNRHPLVSVYDHEGTAVEYTLDATVANRRVLTEQVRVRSGEIRTLRISVPPAPQQGDGRLEVTLNRPGHAAPYRAVWLQARLGTWQ